MEEFLKEVADGAEEAYKVGGEEALAEFLLSQDTLLSATQFDSLTDMIRCRIGYHKVH